MRTVINQVTRSRIDALIAEYRRVAAHRLEALKQIDLTELDETVQQSNAIENSTLSLEDTEQILTGRMPVGRRELQEVYEAKNLAAVTSDLLATRDVLDERLILRWHGMLLAGTAMMRPGGFVARTSGCASAATSGRTPRSSRSC